MTQETKHTPIDVLGETLRLAGIMAVIGIILTMGAIVL